MTYAKLKLALGITAAILLAGGAATVAISQTAAGGKWTPQQIAKQAQDAYAALSSYSDSGTVVSEVAGTSLKTVFNIRLQRPDLYRIDWTQTVGGAASSQGITWSDGTGDFFMMGVNGQEMNPPPRKMKDMQQAFASATGVSSTATAIPATFYRQNFGDTLGVAALGGSELEAEGDEKVGGVDCYVFSSKIDPAKWPDHGKLPNNTGQAGTTTSTFWVGKSDHLIHKMVTTTEGQSFTLPKESDADIKTILERQNKPATPEAIAALRTEMDKSMKLVQGAKVVFTQTHENITVNPKFAPGDFAR
jgi:outer membrane lipoprotein-sorting protein